MTYSKVLFSLYTEICVLFIMSLALDDCSYQFVFSQTARPQKILEQKKLGLFESVVQQKLGHEKSPIRLNKTSDSQRV